MAKAARHELARAQAAYRRTTSDLDATVLDELVAAENDRTLAEYATAYAGTAVATASLICAVGRSRRGCVVKKIFVEFGLIRLRACPESVQSATLIG